MPTSVSTVKQAPASNGVTGRVDDMVLTKERMTTSQGILVCRLTSTLNLDLPAEFFRTGSTPLLFFFVTESSYNKILK